MRILYLSQLVPYPPTAGPKVRSYHVLQYLAEAGHDVTLVAFRRHDDTPDAIAHMAQICDEVHTVLMPRARHRDAAFLLKSVIANTPFLIERDTVGAMTRLIRRLVAQTRFDAVHADQLWMARYALAARRFAAYTPQLVLDKHNAVYLIPQRLVEGETNRPKKTLLQLEARKMARFELETCAQFDKVVWVTDEDRAALTQISNNGWHPSGPTIPICVDASARAPIAVKPDAHRVTFLGGLHWPPNARGILWFADHVWPQILSQVPDAVLTVIGRDPPDGLRAPRHRRIEVTGFVDDLTRYLQETAVFTVPLHAGGGMRVKIVDAWSWGLPIVSTRIGAEGIQYSEGTDIFIADKPAAFAQATVDLLTSFSLREKIGKAGRLAFENQYDWHVVYHDWDAIYPR